MRPPYPLELVPLFLEFLNKRRTKFTFPLRLMEDLGIDRPSLFFAIGGVAPQGGGRLSEMWNPYATQWDQYQAASAAARDAGLVDEKDARWDLTPAGRDLTLRVRREADAYLASLPSPLAANDLARLASLLERAFEGTAASLDRRWHAHIPRARRMAGNGAHPMVALENAVYGLWQARDDLAPPSTHSRASGEARPRAKWSSPRSSPRSGPRTSPPSSRACGATASSPPTARSGRPIKEPRRARPSRTRRTASSTQGGRRTSPRPLAGSGKSSP